ncbi:MAG: hypothetical protein ACJZ70_09130, partial [Limisphaerales bacterium]
APAGDIYVIMSIVDGNMMIKWEGDNSVKLQTSSDLINWQTIDESKGKSEFMIPSGNGIEFFRTIKD